MSKLTMARIVVAILAWGIFMSTYVFADLNKSERCHVENIYHEARGEGWKGWALVKATVENRVKDSRWPSTVCGVVHEYKQFSWTLDPNPVTDYYTWYRIAKFVEEGKHSDFKGATFYHSTSINPWWAKHYKKLGTLGNHTYYK